MAKASRRKEYFSETRPSSERMKTLAELELFDVLVSDIPDTSYEDGRKIAEALVTIPFMKLHGSLRKDYETRIELQSGKNPQIIILQTGGMGGWRFGYLGLALMALAGSIFFLGFRKKRSLNL